jgi:Hemolysin-coregulated protein (uncharacterized)
MAESDYFLKIDGVAGESVDARHKGEIELEAFSWGEMSSAGHAGPGGERRVGEGGVLAHGFLLLGNAPSA